MHNPLRVIDPQRQRAVNGTGERHLFDVGGGNQLARRNIFKAQQRRCVLRQTQLLHADFAAEQRRADVA